MKGEYVLQGRHKASTITRSAPSFWLRDVLDRQLNHIGISVDSCIVKPAKAVLQTVAWGHFLVQKPTVPTYGDAGQLIEIDHGMEKQDEQTRSEGVDKMPMDIGNTAQPPRAKQPPPESSQSIRNRALVIFSFWAVVICLGLPTWWWTTSIHRARLPLEVMLEWADGKVEHQNLWNHP